jgi:hypothetical protein
MRTRLTAAALTAAALLALTACSSDTSQDKPADKPSTSAPATPALSKAQLAQQCTDAVAALTPNADGEVPSEPVPAECAQLSSSEYLDAYMDGISQSNQQGIDDLQDAIDNP